MKILLTADPELPVPPGLYGGIERIVEVLVNEYVARGHEVTLCANALSNVPCKLIGWQGKRSQNTIDIIKNLLTLSSLLYKERFDIVHSFSRLAYMGLVLPLKIPKIMSYQREPSLNQVKKAAQLSKKGSIVFTGCSNYITDQLSQVSEAYTIYNCVPVERYQCKEQIERDAPLIFLGRIEEIKGTHIAIEIAIRTKRRLIIAGNIPPDKQVYFEERVKPYLNDQIVYVGAVNDEQKNNLLGQSLAFLMPIQWNEPFGIVMAEAMACGTPVLAFPKGSAPEIVANGVNGFLCNDVEDMVNRVEECKSLSRKNIRQIAEQRFSNKKISEDYLNLYTQIIER